MSSSSASPDHTELAGAAGADDTGVLIGSSLTSLSGISSFKNSGSLMARGLEPFDKLAQDAGTAL